jgi:hypothetical protein
MRHWLYNAPGLADHAPAYHHARYGFTRGSQKRMAWHLVKGGALKEPFVSPAAPAHFGHDRIEN